MIRKAASGPARWLTISAPEVGWSIASTDGRVELMLSDLTISNGLGWSRDGATMYLADSGPRVIHAFDFDR